MRNSADAALGWSMATATASTISREKVAVAEAPRQGTLPPCGPQNMTHPIPHPRPLAGGYPNFSNYPFRSIPGPRPVQSSASSQSASRVHPSLLTEPLVREKFFVSFLLYRTVGNREKEYNLVKVYPKFI